MFRCILVILLGVASFLDPSRTPAQADDLSFVSIALPQDVRSENVQISYYLVGPFGGYGGYAAKQSGVTSYQIPTVIDGPSVRLKFGRLCMRRVVRSKNLSSR